MVVCVNPCNFIFNHAPVSSSVKLFWHRKVRIFFAFSSSYIIGKMKNEISIQKCRNYLHTLCETIPERSVGSEGNRTATRFFAKTISSFGWQTEQYEFDAMDWQSSGAILELDGRLIEVQSSPYSNPCEVHAILTSVSTIRELESTPIEGKILLMHGELTREQLMPKNFVFYNPEHHQQIIALLEKGKPAAIITATGHNPELAGGLYPYPLIEDGDFEIPSVFITDEEGSRLLPYSGREIFLKSGAVRIPGKGFNVVARTGKNQRKRIVISAHIDAKKGSPGAIDNATGVTVLLLLAEMLSTYKGENMIEIVAFNGEDYYAVPGQMNYIMQNQGLFDQILLNINIDGAGYKDGGTAFSFFDLPQNLQHAAKAIFDNRPGFSEGPPWPQGDHSIFVQSGCPAIAITSEWFLQNMSTQQITHTPDDKPDIVNVDRLPGIAEAIYLFILKI